MTATILTGDLLEVLPTLPADSFDSCVTDPPYNLAFMGKKWDDDIAERADTWRAVLRVLKPGAYLLAFGGTRTHHRMMTAIENAGFELHDTLAWLFGSGMPKSKNLTGAWQGFGTGLKPGFEPIVLAQKPRIGTYQANAERFGVGALNIEGCRIGSESTKRIKAGGRNDFPHEDDGWTPRSVEVGSDKGRWPANVLHDGSDEVLAAFPDSAGQLADASSSSSSRKTQNVYGTMARGNGRDGEPSADSENLGDVGFKMRPGARRGDNGSAARFFYSPKASRTERNIGCDMLDERPLLWSAGTLSPGTFQSEGTHKAARNNHPTVKPIAVMQWLARLVTPPGGHVLDPFTGSGSTGCACALEGFDFTGVELKPEHVQIARARIGAFCEVAA